MKYSEMIFSDAQQTESTVPGIAPALQELIAQDEFAALRKTLSIYAEVLAERAI